MDSWLISDVLLLQYQINNLTHISSNKHAGVSVNKFQGVALLTQKLKQFPFREKLPTCFFNNCIILQSHL